MQKKTQYTTQTSRHRSAGFRTRQCALDAVVRAVLSSPTPTRCPHHMIKAGLRRVPGLDTPEGIQCLRDGESFVCCADGLIGGADSPLLKWNLKYLQKHLPKDMKWSVLHRGTGKIVMTHSNRYLTTEQLDTALDAKATLSEADAQNARFQPVRRVMMSFDEFVAATEAHVAAKARGGPMPVALQTFLNLPK